MAATTFLGAIQEVWAAEITSPTLWLALVPDTEARSLPNALLEHTGERTTPNYVSGGTEGHLIETHRRDGCRITLFGTSAAALDVLARQVMDALGPNSLTITGRSVALYHDSYTLSDSRIRNEEGRPVFQAMIVYSAQNFGGTDVTMANSLSRGRYAISLESGTISDNPTALGRVEDAVVVGSTRFPKIARTLTSGTGSNQALKDYVTSLPIGTGATASLNLTDGSLINGRGEAVSFTQIKRMLLRRREPAAAQYVVVGGTWNGWGHGGAVQERVYGTLLREADYAGLPVTAGNTLTFTAAGSGATLDVVLVGY